MKEVKKKSPRTVRGTATIHEDARIEFTPYAQGEPTQKNVKECTGGKTFETTSATKPLKVVHLSCPANAADPYAEYISQLERLGIKPMTEQQLPTRQRLVNEAGMQVYLDSKDSVLTYQGRIDLTQAKNWQSELMRQLQVVVRSLPCEKKFTQLITKIKKGGTKA